MRKTSSCRVIFLSFRGVFPSRQFPFITSISFSCVYDSNPQLFDLKFSTMNFSFCAPQFVCLQVKLEFFIHSWRAQRFSSFIVEMRAFWIIKIQLEDYMRNMGAVENNKISSRSFLFFNEIWDLWAGGEKKMRIKNPSFRLFAPSISRRWQQQESLRKSRSATWQFLLKPKLFSSTTPSIWNWAQPQR